MLTIIRVENFCISKMTAPNIAYTKLVTAYNEAIASAKVLDVSGLQVDGTGSRKINYPKTGNGTKKWVGDVPVVSDNYASYHLAMQFLGPDFAGYSQQYLNQYGGQKIVRAAKAQRNARLGAAMTAFPVTPNMPAPIAAGTIAIKGVRTPKVPKTPKAKTPKVPKSPAIRQPAILPPVGTLAYAAPALRVATPRVPAPRAVAPTVPRVITPPRPTAVAPRVPTVPLLPTRR